MNKVLKTMVAVAALTLTANAESVTANETAFWNEIQRVFLTWNGKGADQYAKNESTAFTDKIGECVAHWCGTADITQYELYYNFGDAATCNDYHAAYRTIVDALNAFGKITGTKEDKTYLTYEWTLADGTTVKIGPTISKGKKESCTKHHNLGYGCATGMTVDITIKR